MFPGSTSLRERPKTEFMCVSGLCLLKIYPLPQLLADRPKIEGVESKVRFGDTYAGHVGYYIECILCVKYEEKV